MSFRGTLLRRNGWERMNHHLRKQLGVALAASLLLVSSPLASRAVTGASESPNDLRKHALASYIEKKSLDPLNAFPSALEAYERAIKAASDKYGKDSPFIANMHYEIGVLALENAAFPAAHHHLSEAVKLNPNSVMARVKYAHTLEMQGHPDQALMQIQTALARNSRSPEARAALVKWLSKHNQNVAAIRESSAIVAVMQPPPSQKQTKLASAVAPPPMVKPMQAPKPVPKVEAPPPQPVKEEPPKVEDSGPHFEPVNKPKEQSKPVLSVIDILRRQVKTNAPPKVDLEAKQKEAEEKAKQERAKQEKAKQEHERQERERQRQEKAERQRQEKQRNKESRKEKSKPEKKHKPSDLVPSEPGELQALQPSMGVLKTTAKMKDKTAKPKSEPKAEPKESSPTENETPDSGQQVAIPVQTQPMMPAFKMDSTPAPKVKAKRGLVPPPPPMTPVFPVAPMPIMQPSRPIPVKPKKTAPVVREDDTPAAERPAPAPSSGNPEQDSEFMLEWAAVKKKGRGK